MRGRQGKVPDLRLRLNPQSNGQLVGATGGTDTLAEIKCINAGVFRYPRGGDSGRQKAVDKRARVLQSEYEGKLRRMDSQFHGTADGQVGPLVRRLRTYPKLLGYVIGAFGEASQDVHALVDQLAASRLQYLALSSGYNSSSKEKSQIVGQIRRRLSVAFVKANSLCTLSRISNVGPGSRGAAKRREWALREEEMMRKERRSNWTAFIRGGGAKQGGIHFFPH